MRPELAKLIPQTVAIVCSTVVVVVALFLDGDVATAAAGAYVAALGSVGGYTIGRVLDGKKQG